MMIANWRRLGMLFVYSILSLFFFQLLTDLVQGIYAFGVVGTGQPIEMVALLLFFTPLLLFFARNRLSNSIAIILGELILISRVVAVFLAPRGRLLVSGVGVGLFFLLIPCLIWIFGQRRNRSAAADFALGLAVSLALAILLRTLNSGIDLSNVGMFRGLNLLLGIGAGILMPVTIFPPSDQDQEVDADIAEKSLGWWQSLLLSLGMVVIYVLLYLAFTSPSVLSRWAEANYLLVTAVVTLALSVWVWAAALRPQILAGLSKGILMILTGAFVLALILFLWSVRPPSPPLPGEPAIAGPPVSGISQILAFIVLLLFPILIVDFAHLMRMSIAVQPTTASLASSFSLASLVTIIIIIAAVSTRAGSYLPVIGPPFKQKVWLVYLIIGLLILLSLLALRSESPPVKVEGYRRTVTPVVAGVLTLLALASMLAVYLTSPSPSDLKPAGRLKIVAWNIAQGFGFDPVGALVVEGQLNVLQKLEPDLIYLTESDTVQPGVGNIDIVRFLADNLNMHSYYGPTPVASTFGYALLSRYPIDDARSYFLHSGGDHVALIHAKLNGESESYALYVVHHDHRPEDYVPQQKQLQSLVQEELADQADRPVNMVVAGDFNFPGNREQEPDDLALWEDFSRLLNPVDLDDCQEYDPLAFVDHIFVTESLEINTAGCGPGFEPTHPVVWAEFGPVGP